MNNPREIMKLFDIDLLKINNSNDLENIRLKYFGRKGYFKSSFSEAKNLDNSEKVAHISLLNKIKKEAEVKFEHIKETIIHQQLIESIQDEWLDTSLPSTLCERGARHPVSVITNKCIDILSLLGFSVMDGPEIETPFHNFDALNIPKHHPARDLQDTFWLQGNKLLRSHTSTVQIRTLENTKEYPIKIISPGKVYRNETVDATHLACFHQFEGMWVDYDITFSDLKGTLKFIIENMFGDKWEYRMKPKFYPYTEPSIGVDIRLKNTSEKWITILGAGMVHPNVFTKTGHDPSQVKGFAFGLGISRMVAMAYHTDNMKSLYEMDLRVHRELSKNIVN